MRKSSIHGATELSGQWKNGLIFRMTVRPCFSVVESWLMVGVEHGKRAKFKVWKPSPEEKAAIERSDPIRCHCTSEGFHLSTYTDTSSRLYPVRSDPPPPQPLTNMFPFRNSPSILPQPTPQTILSQRGPFQAHMRSPAGEQDGERGSGGWLGGGYWRMYGM